MEAALEGLGLDPETLRLVGSAAAAAAAEVGGAGSGGEEGAGAGLIGALAGLKEAEGRARAAAELLERLGEGSPVAGKVRGDASVVVSRGPHSPGPVVLTAVPEVSCGTACSLVLAVVSDLLCRAA